MRKCLLFLFVLLIPASLWAQTILLDEGFEGTFPPTGWHIKNLGTQTSGETWMQSSSSPHSGTYRAFSQDGVSGDTMNEWLVTDSIIIPSGNNLNLAFWHYLQWASYSDGPEYILISESDTNTSSFTDTVFTLPGQTPTSWDSVNLDLGSVYAGKTIYIAFVHTSANGYADAWCLDDIKLVATIAANHDIGVVSILTPPDLFYPDSAYIPSAIIKNYGTSSETNFDVTCWIKNSSGAVIYNDTTTYSLTLAPDDEDTVTFLQWTPTSSGIDTVYVKTLLADDSDTTNDLQHKVIYSRLHTGGPDAFGYRWIDSDTTDGPVFQWIDATDGTIVGSGDDECFEIPIDFSFSFYGFSYDTIYVGTNGLIGFGSSSGIISPFNGSIPDVSVPNNACYIFWDDLNVVTGGNIYSKLIGTSPDRIFVIEWHKVRRVGVFNDSLTFEILLHENGDIAYQYLDASLNDDNYTQGKSATTGMENSDGTDGLAYLVDGEPIGNILIDSLAIRFYIGEDNQSPVFTTSPKKNTFDTIPVITTQIVDASGLDLDSLYYDVGGGWIPVPSDSMNPSTNTYYYHIPAQPRGTIVNYYFAATDASANQNRGTDPSDAPTSFYTFTILPSSGVTMLFNYSGTQDYTGADYNAYVTALTEAGYSFDTYDRDQENSVLDFYEYIFFGMPTPGSSDSNEVNALLAWLDSGDSLNKKKLFITSGDLGYQQHGHPNGYPNLELFQNYLWADYLGGGNDGLDDDPTTITSGEIWGVPGLFTEGDTIPVTARAPDVVAPDLLMSFSRSIFTYGDGAWVIHGDTNQACGLQVEDTTHNAVYITFNFYEIDSIARPLLLQKCVQWLTDPTGIQENPIVGAPISFSLSPVCPNPSKGDFRIDFSLPVESRVTLKIYGPLGRLRKTLMDEKRDAGVYQLHWENSKSQEKLSVGIYFIKMEAKSIRDRRAFKKTEKVILF